MDVLVLEDVQDLPEERLEEAVGGVVHGVYGPQVALDRRGARVALRQQLRTTQAPRVRVSW